MASCCSDGCVGKINTYIVWWDCLRTAALLHPEECWARLWLSASDRLRPERSSRLPPASLTALPARGSRESQSWRHPLPKSWFAARSTCTGPVRHALSPWRGHAVTVCAAVYLVWHDMTFNKKYRHYQDGLTASAVTSSKKLAWKRPRPRTKKNKKHFSVSDFKPLFTVRINMWLGKFAINAKTSFNTFIFSLSVKVISFITIYSIYVSI